jgi:hypothetical protein
LISVYNGSSMVIGKQKLFTNSWSYNNVFKNTVNTCHL